MHHGPGELEHWIAVPGLVLEALGEAAALDVLEDLAEALRHCLAVHLERAGDAAEHGRRPVVFGGAKEPRLAERLEDRLHLAGHVHLQHQRLGRHARIARDLEGHHDGHAEHGADRLLDEEIEGGFRLGGHLHGARAQHAQALGEPQHPLLGPPAVVGLHAHAGPEAAALQITRPRRIPRHAGRHQQHVDRRRRVDEVEGQAVARAEGDRAAGSERGRDLGIEKRRDDLVGQHHVHDVIDGGRCDRHHLEALRPGLRGVFVFAVTDADLDAGIAQIQGGRPAEMPIPEDGHGFAGESAPHRVRRAIHPDLRLSRLRHGVVDLASPAFASAPLGSAPGHCSITPTSRKTWVLHYPQNRGGHGVTDAEATTFWPFGVPLRSGHALTPHFRAPAVLAVPQ